jgi:hypothetical protein
MRLFHRTSAENAALIMSNGFRDASGDYGTSDESGKPILWTGVWLSDVPLDSNEGLDGDTMLEVIFDDVAESILDDFEWVEEGKPYREWLVPAAALKLITPQVRIVSG